MPGHRLAYPDAGCLPTCPVCAVYAKAFSDFFTAANKKHLDIGRNGKSVFSRLPYYRCGTITDISMFGCIAGVPQFRRAAE